MKYILEIITIGKITLVFMTMRLLCELYLRDDNKR